MGLQPGGTWTIYLVPADGGKTEQLLGDKEFYADPNWSPDGSRLIYGESAMEPKTIHVLDLQSRRVSDLPGSKRMFSPRWSPDGHFILAMTATLVASSHMGQPPPVKIMRFDFGDQKWQQVAESESPAYPSFSRTVSSYISPIHKVAFFGSIWLRAKLRRSQPLIPHLQ